MRIRRNACALRALMFAVGGASADQPPPTDWYAGLGPNRHESCVLGAIAPGIGHGHVELLFHWDERDGLLFQVWGPSWVEAMRIEATGSANVWSAAIDARKTALVRDEAQNCCATSRVVVQ